MKILTRDEITSVSGGDLAAILFAIGPLLPVTFVQPSLLTLSLNSGITITNGCPQVNTSKDDKSGGS